MKTFQRLIAVSLISLFGLGAFSACNVVNEAHESADGVLGKSGSKNEQLLLFLLIILFLNQEEETSDCSTSVLSPSVSSSDFAGDGVQESVDFAADAATGKAYFDTPGGRKKFAYTEWQDYYVVQGDMLFPEKSKNQSDAPAASGSAAIGGTNTSVGINGQDWPSTTITYSYDGSNPADSTKMDAAMSHWTTHSKFTFSQVGSGARIVYTQPTSSGNCSSVVGYYATTQTLNLGSSCSIGNAVHEIGHALGLYHEQGRSDRDNFVTIHESEISSGAAGNFEKETDATDYGEYDFNSIMHYGSYFFATGSNPTITRVSDGGEIDAQRNALTGCDVFGAESTNNVN